MAANISIPTDDLLSHRPATVGRMLAVLRDKPVPCQPHLKSIKRMKVIAAHGGGARPDSEFQSWRFQTVAKTVECQYYELWRFSPNQRTAFLDKAYLHLFRKNSNRTTDQLICIHAEPYAEHKDDADAVATTYRQGLHLHVSMSVQPLPKCHFPLVLSHIERHLEDMLSSVDNLTATFERAIHAVRLEVLSRFN